MDDLRTTLLTFSADDRLDLARFLQGQRQRANGRLDARLCELLLRPKELPAAALIAQLYPDAPNPVAYYALRKRLLLQLTDFLVLRQSRCDATATASVRGQLTLAQYLFEVGVPRLAWTILRKAEKQARQNEQYEPLNAVYNLQIQHAHSPHAEPLADILPRRHRNKKAADEEERANIADSLLRQRLRQARTAPAPAENAPDEAVSFEQLVQNVLREYDLQEAFARSPALLARLMGIARSAMLVRGDFARFAAFLERCYCLMERRHGFGPAHRGHQLRLLYMLAHAHYRSRHFAEAAARATEGRVLLATGRQREHAEFTPRFALLLAAAEAFRGRNTASIALLSETLARKPALALTDELTARLQLAFHYFAASDFAQANKILTRLGQSDHWLEQRMGLNWLLAKILSEMLLLTEMGHDDLALDRLRATERLLHERYPDPDTPGGPFRYVLAYLVLVRQVLQHQDLTATQRQGLRHTTEQLTALVPHRRDDLQARSFYAWLLARLSGRPFYAVLLEITDRPATKKGPNAGANGPSPGNE